MELILTSFRESPAAVGVAVRAVRHVEPVLHGFYTDVDAAS